MTALAPSNLVRLLVNGRWHEGWTSATVTRDIEQLAATWSVSLASTYPDQVGLTSLRADDLVDIYIGDDLVITGFVDQAGVEEDAKSSSGVASGRSRTGELADCSPDPDGPVTFRNQKLEVIAEQLADYYDVEVVCDVDTGPRLGRLRIQTEESVFDSIERASRDRGLLLTDDAWGRLVMTRAGTGRADDPLVRGPRGNILQGGARAVSSGRFSEYRVKGQRAAGSDWDSGADVTAAVGGARDVDLQRRRVKVIKPSGAADAARCRELAEWEATTRAGKGLTAAYIVQGWRQSTGRLWATNERVLVTDPRVGFAATELLITAVTFSLDARAGSLTALQLAPVQGFAPPPARQPGTGGGGTLKELSNGAELPYWSRILTSVQNER